MRKTTLREVKMLRLLRSDSVVELKEAFRRKRKLVRARRSRRALIGPSFWEGRGRMAAAATPPTPT